MKVYSRSGLSVSSSLSSRRPAPDLTWARPGRSTARPSFVRPSSQPSRSSTTDGTRSSVWHRRGLSPREHWTRIKALNKRFAEASGDQYDTLRPSAELREFVKEELYRQLESPRGWNGHRPDDAEHTAIVNELAQAVARGLNAPISGRLSTAAQPEWERSYDLYGSGSTRLRADHIAHDIFDRFVPEAASNDNSFVADLLTVVEAAAAEVDASLE